MAKGRQNSSAGALVRHTFVYGIGSAITAAGGFVLIPLYTNALIPSEYGLLEILNRVADIVILLAFLGTRQAYIRFFFDKSDEAWHRTVTSTTLSFSIAMSVAISLVVLILARAFPGWLDNSGVSQRLILIICLWMPFEVLFNVTLTYLRVNVRSAQFVVVNAVRLVLFIAFNVLFLLVLETGVEGVFSAQLFVTAAIGTVFLIHFRRWCGAAVDVPLLWQMLKFGLPYLPAAACMFVISNADRFFLGSFHSLQAVGLLALGSKIGAMGLTLFMRPFEMVWSPFVFAVHEQADGGSKIGSAFTVYTGLCAYLGLGVALTGPIIIRLIAEEAYQGASVIVPIIAVGSVLYGMATLIDAGVLIAKQTKYKPAIFGVAALFAVVFHSTITVKFGLVGASIASTLTFGVLFFVNYRVSERFYHVVLFKRDFAAITFSSLSCFLLGYWLLAHVDGLLSELFVLTIPAIAYPILFMSLSRYSAADLKGLFAELKDRNK